MQARAAERAAIQAELALAAREEALRREAERLRGWTDDDGGEGDKALANAVREQVGPNLSLSASWLVPVVSTLHASTRFSPLLLLFMPC